MVTSYVSNSSQYISLDVCENLRLPNICFSKSADPAFKENLHYRVVVSYIRFEKKNGPFQIRVFSREEKSFFCEAALYPIFHEICVSHLPRLRPF